MSKATPGTPYIVVKGDTLSGIAYQAYGNGRKWRAIWRANKQTIKSGNPHIIYPGEILQIPTDKERDKLKSDLRSDLSLEQEFNEQLRIIVDGQEIRYLSARAVRTMDTLADGFSFVVDGNEYGKFTPYGYQRTEVYIDDELIITGKIYNITASINTEGYKLSYAGFSGLVDILDSCSRPPYSQKNVTLKKAIETIVDPFGVTVIDNENKEHVFKKVLIEKTGKIGDFILGLSSQVGALLTSTPEDDIEITSAKLKTSPVAVLTLGQQYAEDLSISFDGRRRFSEHIAYGKGPDKNKSVAIPDKNIGRVCIDAFSSDENRDKITDAAKWRRNKAFAESLSFQLPVDGFYDDNGDRWRENTIITVQDKRLFMKDGFDFVVSAVEFTTAGEKKSTALTLVPPFAYTLEEVVESWK